MKLKILQSKDLKEVTVYGNHSKVNLKEVFTTIPPDHYCIIILDASEVSFKDALSLNNNNINTLIILSSKVVDFEGINSNLELRNLKRLEIIDSELRNVKKLSNLPLLEHLVLKRCNLTQTNFLNDLPYLKWLDLSNNALEKIDLSFNSDLKHLDLSVNKLTTIKVSNLHKIKSLYLDGNSLNTFEIANKPDLEYLTIHHNFKLLQIKLTQCPSIDSIGINNNTKIISDNPDIYDYVSSYNTIES